MNVAPAAERAFRNPWFSLAWAVFLGVLVTRLWWMRDALLVWWVHGRDAYFRDGVRVLPGKPIRFSTGELAPLGPDLATGFGFFFALAFGLTAILVLGLRAYDRFRKEPA